MFENLEFALLQFPVGTVDQPLSWFFFRPGNQLVPLPEERFQLLEHAFGERRIKVVVETLPRVGLRGVLDPTSTGPSLSQACGLQGLVLYVRDAVHRSLHLGLWCEHMSEFRRATRAS